VESHPRWNAAADHLNSYLHLQSYLVPTGSIHKGNTLSFLQLATITLAGGSHIYMGQSSAWWLHLECTIKIIILLCSPGTLIGLGLFMQERIAFVFSFQIHMI